MLLHNIILDMTIGMVVFISLLLGGFYYLAFYDNGDSIKEETNNLISAESRVQKQIIDLKKNLAKLRQMKQVLDKTQGEVNKFLKFMPNTLTSLMILNNLNANAKLSGVKLENITNREHSVKNNKPYNIIEMKLDIKGSFSQILEFLSQLTSSPKILTFHNFGLKNQDSNNNEGRQKNINDYGRNTQMIMNATVYAYKYNEPIQASASNVGTK